MLQPSSPRSLIRFRIHINDRSLAVDQLTFEARKPTSAYVSSETKYPFLDQTPHPETRLRGFNAADLFNGSKLAIEIAVLTRKYWQLDHPHMTHVGISWYANGQPHSASFTYLEASMTEHWQIWARYLRPSPTSALGTVPIYQ